MTLCGENRKWLISSGSFDALLALFGRVKPGVPASVTQGAKAGSEILSPQATAGPANGSRALLGPGKGHSSIRADSQGSRVDSRSTGTCELFTWKNKSCRFSTEPKTEVSAQGRVGNDQCQRRKNGF